MALTSKLLKLEYSYLLIQTNHCLTAVYIDDNEQSNDLHEELDDYEHEKKGVSTLFVVGKV